MNEIKDHGGSHKCVSKWEIRVDGDKVFFTRFSETKPHEAYAPVSKDKASVYAAAIIHGYQPPRALDRLDTLSD